MNIYKIDMELRDEDGAWQDKRAYLVMADNPTKAIAKVYKQFDKDMKSYDYTKTEMVVDSLVLLDGQVIK